MKKDIIYNKWYSDFLIDPSLKYSEYSIFRFNALTKKFEAFSLKNTTTFHIIDESREHLAGSYINMSLVYNKDDIDGFVKLFINNDGLLTFEPSDEIIYINIDRIIALKNNKIRVRVLSSNESWFLSTDEVVEYVEKVKGGGEE